MTFLLSFSAPKGNATIGKYLNWESEDGNAYCCGGIYYSSGHLVVPRQGLYRVFLQVTFGSTAGLCETVMEVKLTNIVYLSRRNYRDYVPILSSVDTVPCSQESWSKSLYTSSLFRLEANSKLAVGSNWPELISKRQDEVFFGIEFVS